MGFLSRSPTKRRAHVLAAAPDDLKRIGVTAFGGETVYPRGLSDIPVGELDRYAIAFLEAAGYPSPGTPQWDSAQSRFLDELSDVAKLAGDWAFVGALCVGLNCVGYQSVARIIGIWRSSTGRSRSCARTAFPIRLYHPSRWTGGQSVHGFGDVHPKGWPSALA